MVKYSELKEAQGTEEKFEETIKMTDVIGQPITIVAFKQIRDKFSDKETDTVIVMDILQNAEKKTVFTRSAVLTKQLMYIKDKLPVETTIQKQKRYLTFT